MRKLYYCILFLVFALQVCAQKETVPYTDEMITEAWHSGQTLPVEVALKYPPKSLNLKEDKGYNVLVDVAHQCSFASMWTLSPRLHGLGYRSHSSHAVLNSVLNEKGVSRSRIRIPYDEQRNVKPFAWYPNEKYNIVITEQQDARAQEYTDKEITALTEFVKKGGGLVIMSGVVKDEALVKAWSLNKLAAAFDAELIAGEVKYKGDKYMGLKGNQKWEVVAKSEDGTPVQMRRTFGKGRVMLIGSVDAFRQAGKDKTTPRNVEMEKFVGTTLAWLCEQQQPIGGEPRMARSGGGADIYPELEFHNGDIITFYAENQEEHLLKTIREEFPRITKQVNEWLPSTPTKEPMYLILAAGDGGGWAVNNCRPKENGVISLKSEGIISIYAHELAHTMFGPANEEGEVAGRAAIRDRGEAHAGWFQGKIDALYSKDKLEKPNRNCNEIFEAANFKELDFTQYYENDALQQTFGKGKDWQKTWYIWQKLDDHYGPTWFPRWKWIQHNRWSTEPKRELTWEETFEDMSIAVGEDLFPFIKACGINLNRPTMGTIAFQGNELTLPIAPIEVTAPGKVRTEAIGDYKKPLK